MNALPADFAGDPFPGYTDDELTKMRQQAALEAKVARGEQLTAPELRALRLAQREAA
jgi:hypothetical protein